METSDFDYYLPEELIAKYPLTDRSKSRLLYVPTKKPFQTIEEFFSLNEFLDEKDVLVLNDTKVIKSRLSGKKASGGKVEFLCTKILSSNIAKGLLRSNRVAKIGEPIIFPGGISAEIIKVGGGEFTLTFNMPVVEVLDGYAKIALPPYINRDPDSEDEYRYQTVYGKNEGAIAAPTAGLHFDKNLLNSIKNRGIQVIFLTLHVGIGTFLPVKTRYVHEHKMHSEEFNVPGETADIIQKARQVGGRVVAVGTTTMRALESVARSDGLVGGNGYTDIFITPGFEFRVVDVLITNFHLPKSTLLMLVYAFGGRENVEAAYKYAIKKRLRFFSYGDAMCITRQNR